MISEPIQRPNKENKLEFWKSLISELKNSNLTINQFCQKKNISSSTLYKWKNTIEGHKKIGASKKTSPNALVSNFIEIPVKKQNHSSVENINIIFPNGLKVIFNVEIEPLKLVQILKGLGS
jgi:predicted transcriptional regulator